MDISDFTSREVNGASVPEGLQETYTDFDAWITKWSWKIKQRSHPAKRSVPLNKKLDSFDEETKRNLMLENLLVKGFASNKTEGLKNIFFKLENTDDCIYLDYVLIRLCNGNDTKRNFIVNSKL